MCNRLFNSTEPSDFVVRCGDREWQVYKQVLCTKSDYFNRAIKGSFKASDSVVPSLGMSCSADIFPTTQESQENSIDLQEDDPDAVDLLLEFLYTGDYTTNPGAEAEGHVSVFEIASKYLLDSLKELAERRFNEEMRRVSDLNGARGCAQGIAALYNLDHRPSFAVEALQVVARARGCRQRLQR